MIRAMPIQTAYSEVKRAAADRFRRLSTAARLSNWRKPRGRCEPAARTRLRDYFMDEIRAYERTVLSKQA